MPFAPRPPFVRPIVVRPPRVKPPMELDGLADIGALISALGGNAAVPAFYDARTGVTVVSGAVSQWDDVRGSVGFAPSLAQATASARPTFDPVAMTVTCDGLTQEMTTAGSALFDHAGAYSLVFIGAIQATGATGYNLAIADSSGLNRYMLISNTAGGVIRAENKGLATLSSTGTVSTTRRLVIASKNASTGYAIDVASVAQVSGTGIAAGAGNNMLTFGSIFAAGGNNGKPIARAILCLARQVTAGDIAILLAGAQTNHGVVAA